MDFSEKIANLADRAQKIRGSLATEEATKTALVMPFIQALGYDVFNPLEVVPEFVADVAGRKGEKIDYAIVQDGRPIMLIECKTAGAALNEVNREQLHRYFLTLEAAIGVLTNGVRWLFFSAGADGKNLDTTPFMELSLDGVDANLLPELAKLRKGKFELQNTLGAVSELKFNRQVKLALAASLEAPDPDFVDYFLAKAGIKGLRKEKKEERYVPYTKRAFVEFITEQVDGRLKTALAAASKPLEEPPPAPAEEEEEDIITELEWQAYYAVKSILMGTVAPERVVLRNLAGTGRSGVGIDTNRKPLAVFNFLDPQKMRIEIVTDAATRDRQTHQIAKVDDILQYAETIKAVAAAYLAGKQAPPAAVPGAE
jgi:hypothetical protein